VRVGELQKLGDFDLRDAVVRSTLAKRYGTSVPYDELVISPVAIFDSPLLEVVAER
jgi:hypothetical protein